MTDLKLTTGEAYTVLLGGAASGGYTWGYVMEGDKDAVVVEEKSTVDRPPVGSLPQTYEAQLAYSITAVRPGRVTLRFFLHRVWESSKPPVKEEEYAITVADKASA